MIKIIHSSILCKWANLQNQQGIKELLLPLYTLASIFISSAIVAKDACMHLVMESEIEFL